MKKTAPFALLLHLLRPQQWLKNIFVFAGLIFSHDWHQPVFVYPVLLAFVAFCCMASAVYIYNDIYDFPFDKLHPYKSKRAIASGKVSFKTAKIAALFLVCLSLSLSFFASPNVVFIMVSYVLLNVAYTHYLKNIVIIDVFAIAMGFMLRIFAGTVGVGIPLSPWLTFCGLMLTLFLGFVKRRAEHAQTQQQVHLSRKVLKEYHHIFLDKMIGITASCSIIGYGIYTMAPETIRAQHTINLIYTVPFVIYGIFRYLYLLHHSMHHAGEDTAKDVLQDKPMLITLASWLMITLWIIS